MKNKHLAKSCIRLKRLVTVIILTVISSSIFAQIPIKGTVTDSQGEPLIGVAILIKNTTTGISTDIDGKFSLEVPNEQATLVIRYIGYKDKDEKIGSKRNFNIVLQEDFYQLDEIVVVGYGQQRRGSITGSVASIDNKDLVKAPVADITNSLGGKLPGVRSITRSGQPGDSGANIDIRGFGSALIIVDGVPGSFNHIDPNEIDNITILKDASAAVYGVKAANGVILVTTKKGISGKTQINLNTTFSWQTPTKYPKLANAAQFVELTDEDKINRGNSPLYGPEELAKWRKGGEGYESTDWYNETVRTWAPQQQYNLNVRGGNDNVKYFTSVAYMKQGGMWKQNSIRHEKYNIRSNIDAKVTKNLTSSIYLSGIKQDINSPITSNGYIMAGIQKSYPTMKPYANNNKNYYADTNAGVFNPLALTDKSYSGYNKTVRQTFEGSAILNYDFSDLVKGLSVKAMYHYRFRDYETKRFQKKYNVYKYQDGAYNATNVGNAPSSVSVNDNKYFSEIFQGSINYNNVFADKHDVGGLLLFETRKYNDRYLGASREFLIDAIDEINNGVDKNKNNSGTSETSRNAGLVGRATYAYDGKYLLEASFRYDGSSKFHEDNRWGFFPSISAGWRISQENFFKDNISFINNLKLRASWGRLGDDAAAQPFQYLTGYTYPSGSHILGNDIVLGLSSSGLANERITWSTSDLYNFGIDFSILDGIISGEFDAFYRKRDGLLGNRAASLPGTFGASLPQENINSDSDRGYEISISHKNTVGNGVNYSVKANMSYTRSKYEHIERAESTTQMDNWRNNSNARWKNITWGYKHIGQFQSYEEIANSPVQDGKGNLTLRPGDLKYLDYNGDGVIDGNDTHAIGRGAMPEYMFGLEIAVDWKGIDLSMFFQGSANFNAYLQDQLQVPLFNAENSYKEFMNRWHREDIYDVNSKWIPGKYPATYAGGLENNKKVSTFWLQNASYIRLKEIQLGYTLPKHVTKKVNIENLRFFVAGYNLLTFSGMKLLDPESNSINARYYPQQKMVSMGFNLNF